MVRKIPTVVRWICADNLPYEKVGKNEPVCIADEVPFEIPESWEWVRLGSIGDWGAGATPSRSIPEYYGGDIPWLKTGDLNDGYIEYIPENISSLALEKTSVRLNPTGSVLIAMYGATIGKVGILTFPATTNQACCACLPIEIYNEYLFYFLMSQKVAFVKQGEGGAQPNISKEKIVTTLMPLPSLAEQYRIVNKIKELLPYVERYSETYLAVNSLNATFPNLLKKSILQEAVQGKLVPQDPADEPASVLLERIRAEKEQLIKAGKIKRDKHESIIFRRDNSHYEKLDGSERCIDDEIPFEIPSNWKWVRLGQVIVLLSGTDFKSEEYNEEYQGIPYITGASSLSENRVLLNRWTKTPKVIANRGDVLLVCKGSGYGKTVICDIEEAHIARQIMAIKKLSTLNMDYIRLFLQANLDQIKSKGQGVIPGIDRNSVMNFLFPLPPLPEQRRIVKKQQELFDKITLI